VKKAGAIWPLVDANIGDQLP